MKTTNQQDLLSKVEEVVQHIEKSGRDKVPIHSMIDAIVRELGNDLGIFGARLYERGGEDYVLLATFPGGLAVDDSVRVPRDYAPMELCLMRGVVYMQADDPRLDRALEAVLGAGEFAAVEVGAERYVIAFDVEPGRREDVVNALGVVRHAITQKIREQQTEEIFRQAKQIQTSIMPEEPPSFHFYDIAGRSDSLDSVGGDLFDYIPIHHGILGIAIADASGHGLPAALQVRDVYMGLRMGMARDLKIVRTVERLNQIINSSTLSSRFVSLFYGELEPSGLFIYVNAGHPSPFHLPASPNRPVMRLQQGGPILGPLGDATYDRGFVRLDPGDVLVLYTDGITETRDRAATEPGEAGEEYGVARLQEVVSRHRDRCAEEILDAIFEDLRVFSDGAPTEDDRTVIVIRYPD